MHNRRILDFPPQPIVYFGRVNIRPADSASVSGKDGSFPSQYVGTVSLTNHEITLSYMWRVGQEVYFLNPLT